MSSANSAGIDPEPPASGRGGLGSAVKPILAIVILGVATVAAAHFAFSPRAASPPAAAPVPLVTAVVRRQDTPIILTGLGAVQAFNTATIRSQVTGVLERVDFVEGQTVKRGDALAQIDPRLFEARLNQAEAQLARDQADFANTQKNLGRDQPLLQRGFASDQTVADLAAKVSQLQNTLKADQAAVDAAQIELDYATLRAPFDGVTGLRLIDIGNVIHPTDPTGVVVLTQVQPISVIFTLPAIDIPATQAALARGSVRAAVFDQSGLTKLDTGTLLTINNMAATTSGSVEMKAIFPNANRQLWPGALVNAEITTSTVKDALTIPTDAIQENDQGAFVFVVGADNRASVRPVEIGQRMRGAAIITKGLSAGETVVVQGQYRLLLGTEVTASAPAQVQNASTASAGMLP